MASPGGASPRPWHSPRSSRSTSTRRASRRSLGSTALILALIAFALGATTVGWGLALAVAALQTLLATTGYCLGCRLYFLRWWVPDLVTRIWTRGRVGGPDRALAPDRIRYS